MTYDNFKDEILLCFTDLIDKYDLTLFEHKREKGWYLLKNTYCTLWFSYDRGQINCEIESKVIANHVLDLFNKANPSAPLPRAGDPWLSINQLNNYAFMIENSDLKKTLTGDDSWLL